MGLTALIGTSIKHAMHQSVAHARGVRRRATWVLSSLAFIARSRSRSEKRLLAICDFRTMPYTVGELLYFQEMTLALRIEYHVDKVDIVWLCDPANPARGADQGITPDNYHLHLSRLLPLAHVNPHLGSFMLMDSSDRLNSYIVDNIDRYHVWPSYKDYSVKRPTYPSYFNNMLAFHARHGFIPYLSCKSAMVDWASSFLQREAGGRLPVVAHLRKMGNATGRNALLDCWLEFFDYCRTEFADVQFIIIGDREEIDPRFRRLSNVIFSKDYGTTIEQDLALIQSGNAYIGCCSGVAMMSLFSDKPYVVFNFQPCYENVPYGTQLPFATPLQKLVWEPENTTMLMEEFSWLHGEIHAIQKEELDTKMRTHVRSIDSK